MSVGDQTNDPTILIKETVLRGKTTISLKEFNDRPTGIVSNANDKWRLLSRYIG